MKTSIQLRLTVVFSLLTIHSFGQSLDIDNIYNFSPSKLTKAEEEAKLPALDGLWGKVKSDTTINLPLLRKELTAPNHNPFFYYDGSMLLLSLSKNDNDKTAAAEAIAKCDLSDIDQQEYVRTLNQLSNDGINVTKAAVQVLKDTSFDFFLPQHVMYFRQGDCLTYMLLPQKAEFYVDTLMLLFKSVNTNSQKSILYLLWFAYTCKGDSLINSAIYDRTLNKEVSSYAKELMKSGQLDNETKRQINSMTRSQVEELRNGSLRRFSDEALDELMISTLALRKDTNCR